MYHGCMADPQLSAARRRYLWCAGIGLTGLAALIFAYWFTHEPAPGIRVTWRSGVTLDAQEAAERKYLLASRRAPHEEQPRSLAYDLLDTRQSNIAALLNDPAVEDTNDIDDQWARVRLGTAYGDQWMWVAHRTPLLRYREVRWTLVVTLSGAAVFGVWGLLRWNATRIRR